MILCTNLQKQVLDLQKAKDAQAKEIDDLKKRVQKLEKRKKSRITGFKRLRKFGSARRIESSEDKDSLGDQEDPSKQGRRIANLDANAEVTLINKTQERQDEDFMFDVGVLDGDKVIVDMEASEKEEQSTKVDEMEVSTAEVVTTASEADTTARVKVSAAPKISVTTAVSTPQISKDELSLAQTLIEIKAAKYKAITTAATTVTTAAVTRPKAKRIVFHDQKEQVSVSKLIVPPVQPTIKDKGKAFMQEPEKPEKFRGKYQMAADEELAKRLDAEIQAELLEEERLARKKEEEANIALIESWENTQAMMEADRLLAERLQTREREELTDEEKAKLFMEFMKKRRKHFVALREQEKRNRPPTKAQKRSQMSTYLKYMGRYKHNQLKGKSYEEIQKLFDKEMKRVNTFMAIGSEAQESRGKKDESSSKKEEIAQDSSAKRSGDDLEANMSKKHKTDQHKEVEVDDEAELKKHMKIVKDDEVAIDSIHLATKPPMIVEYKIVREGIMGHFQLIRADGSTKRYTSMIRMLQHIDREDLETL
ncbi:hypothetical protein Tco_0389961 [Tanacetum coccineum]